MSPYDRSKSQPASEGSTFNTQKENVTLALRPLAPKAAPRFRPLAIRGSSESLFASSQGQAPHSGQSRGRTAARCPVCYKRNCPLASHRIHDEARRLRRSQTLSATRATVHQDNSSASYAVEFAALYNNATPSSVELGILTQLPIPDDLNRPLMHQLFHTWFVLEAPEHFTVPHPVESRGDLLHGPFFAPAFTDPVLCLSILTISAASRPQTSMNSNNVLALTLCDQAMSKLRQRVNEDRDTVRDTTIVAATYLWAANLYLADDASLRQHASSVRALVEARRYSQNSGLSDAVSNLFKWVDIMNTLRLNQPSQYPDDRKHKVLQTFDRQSGDTWLHSEGEEMPVSDEAILNTCRQCCQLIDLLNQVDLDDIEGTTYFYLFERAAQLYQENSLLRAKYIGTGTVEECVTLAIDILKLLVFNGGGKGASRLVLKLQAKYLSKAIQAAGAGMFWRTKMELFVWLVFLVYVSNPTESYRDWSMIVLRGALEHVFGSRTDWSKDTINKLAKILFGFGWTSTKPLGDLRKLVDRLWT